MPRPTPAKIRIVIVDDEPIARRGIRQFLAMHDDVDIVGEARNGEEAVQLLHALTPDLVFLDIQMPELDGFGVLRRLDPARLPMVIFVTAFDTFAVRAFEQHALDYLVKPVHEQRFHDALARARRRLRSEEAAQRLSELLTTSTLTTPTPTAPLLTAPTPRRIVIDAGGSELLLDVAEIEWVEAEDYYAAMHARGRRHLIRESLASLEARLDPTQFVRVHRSAIVNLAQVREVRNQSAGESSVVLRDGTQLPLSRRRREQVAAAVRRFAG